MTYPRIKNRESSSFRDFAKIIDKAFAHLEETEHFTSANSLETLKRIVEKLPGKLQDDWMQWPFSIIEKIKKEAMFQDLAAFICQEADMPSSASSR